MSDKVELEERTLSQVLHDLEKLHFPDGDEQVGGDHYRNKVIEPIEYIMENELSYCEGNVIKYVTRHREKGGSEDIRKAIQYCKFILRYEYGEEA